jgi:hypothetical protein
MGSFIRHSDVMITHFLKNYTKSLLTNIITEVTHVRNVV